MNKPTNELTDNEPVANQLANPPVEVTELGGLR